MKQVIHCLVGCGFGIGAWFVWNAMDAAFAPDPVQIAQDAYITECMEARIGWRKGTNGFYDRTTATERIRMAELCRIEFDSGVIGPVVQAVRDGELTVRGEIDPRFHPEQPN